MQWHRAEVKKSTPTYGARWQRTGSGPLFAFLVLLLLLGSSILVAGCRGRVETPALAKAAPQPPPSSDAEPEDPPYSPDSVFRPNEHRPRVLKLPDEALLAGRPITGHDTGTFAHFGAAIALDGALAVVGAPFANEGGQPDSGSAYVFRKQGDDWLEVAKLIAPTPATYDHFGRSVAISGSTVVVGADGVDGDELSDLGATFVFEGAGNDFRLAATLRVPEPSDHGEVFGFAVAIDGGTIAVGAPGKAAGEVLVFSRHGADWTKEAALRVEALSGRSGFGHAVEVDGDRMLAGAPAASGEMVLSGKAFLFERRGSWQLVQELVPPQLHGGERFGRAVALAGDLALVSAPRSQVENRTRAGKVWAFRRGNSGWSMLAGIEGDPPRSDGEFGRTLALGARWAVIGSQFFDAMGQATGGAEFFAVEADSKLRHLGPLLAADARPMNEFASAAAVGEHEVLIGAPRRGTNDNATGYVYSYTISGEAP